MRKLQGWKEMVKDGIYNTVYVGDNETYAKINGRQTIVVLGLKPFRFQELFYQFGNPFTDDLRGEVVTSELPEECFKDREIFVPEKDTQWFKKSMRVKSIAAAIQQKLLTKTYLKGLRLNNGYFCPHFDAKSKLKGVVGDFSVEGKTAQPLLQAVFIVWKTWEDLFRDFKAIGITVK